MPATLTITPWPDPLLDTLGHDPRSLYVETFWLPTLGPTAVLLLRHLATRFDESPTGVELAVADTSQALGLGQRDGNSSPIVRTLTRLSQFDLACDVSATGSSTPLGDSSNLVARWRSSSTAVGPSVGSQNVSTYSERGSWPSVWSSGSGQGVIVSVAGIGSSRRGDRPGK